MKRWVVRIVGACAVLAACADLPDDFVDGDTGMSGTGGNTSEAGTGTGGNTSEAGTGTGGNASEAGTGGHEDGPGGSEATGGSATGEAGSDSGGMGGTGGSMPPTCATDCRSDVGTICDADTLTCVCPPEAPDHCPNDDVHCTNVMGNDDDHCGDCVTKCTGGSVCNGGTCSALPEAIYVAKVGSYISSNLLLSGDTLYWAEAHAVFSMAATGGPVTPLGLAQGSQGLSYVSAMVADSTNLYAYDRNVDFTPPSLYRIPLSGAAPERIVHEGGIAQSARRINDLALQAGVLYYTVGNQVKSVPADASEGTGTVVATAAGSRELFQVAVDGSLLFWSTQQEPTGDYEVEGDLISGGARRTLGASTQWPLYGGLTTDGTHVYWANGGTLQRRVYDASTASETIASTPGPEITTFAVNATTAYYLTRDARVEKATFGGKPQAIAQNQHALRSLVVGESSVYWINGSQIIRTDL